MEITVTLNHGQLDAEFSGDDREEIEENLLGFTEFLEEHSEEFNGLNVQSVEPEKTEPQQSSVDENWENQTTTANGSGDTKFESIAQRARESANILSKFLRFPEDEDKVPYLRLDVFEQEEDVLGGSRREKQARASLILLFLWQELGNVEEVESAELNKALQTSRINPKSRKNMYQALDGEADNFFTRDNQGNVGLTQAGEIAAVDQISSLAEEYESQ